MNALALLGGPVGVDTLIRRTTRVTPIAEVEREKSKADRELAIGVGALRAFAVKIDRLASRSHASWDTLVVSNTVREAAAALEKAVLDDGGIAA